MNHEVWSHREEGPGSHCLDQPCAIQWSLCAQRINLYLTKIVSVCANQIKLCIIFLFQTRMMNQRNVKGPNQSGLEIIYKSSFDCFVQASLVKHYIPYNNLDVYDPLHNNVVNNSFLDCKKRRINGIIQRIYTNIRKTLSMEYCCILSRFYQIFIYSIYCQIIYNLFAAIIYLLLRV